MMRVHDQAGWMMMARCKERRARDRSAGDEPVSDYKASGREMLQRTAKSCGPDASVVGVKFAELSRPNRA